MKKGGRRREGLHLNKQTERGICVHSCGYLSDEDTGDALRIVSFGVRRPKQLLTFTLLKAVQEGRVQDVLQHLTQDKKQVKVT